MISRDTVITYEIKSMNIQRKRMILGAEAIGQAQHMCRLSFRPESYIQRLFAEIILGTKQLR